MLFPLRAFQGRFFSTAEINFTLFDLRWKLLSLCSINKIGRTIVNQINRIKHKVLLKVTTLSNENPVKSLLKVVYTPYPINKSATIEVIQNRIVERELREGKSNNR